MNKIDFENMFDKADSHGNIISIKAISDANLRGVIKDFEMKDNVKIIKYFDLHSVSINLQSYSNKQIKNNIMVNQSNISIIAVIASQIQNIENLNSQIFGSHRGYVPKAVKIAPELKEQLTDEILREKGLESVLQKDEIQFQKVLGVDIQVAESVRDMNPDPHSRTLGFPIQVLMRIRTEGEYENYQEAKRKEQVENSEKVEGTNEITGDMQDPVLREQTLNEIPEEKSLQEKSDELSDDC